MSYLSSEHSSALLAAEESSSDLLAPAAEPPAVGVPDSFALEPPLHSVTSQSRQLMQASARHNRRLQIIAAGDSAFGGGADSQSFSPDTAVVGHGLHLMHSLSEGVLVAALQHNPLFSVLEAAEQSQQRYGTAPVRTPIRYCYH